jgi:UDP-N-acetylmuramoylalanine--D-glutamate ligase
MKNIVILGAGESGVGAAILAQKKGYKVFVSDAGLIKSEYLQILQNYGIDYEQEKHSEYKLLHTADLVVKSPGIPTENPLIQSFLNKGIEVIDEIELAFRYADGSKIIAITGSNGKTTTTLLIYHLLVSSGYNVALVGNIGFSFAKRVAENPADYYVLEASSFQLDGIKNFSPTVGILLNISPDHLDRYHYDINNYIASKFRIAENKQPEQFFIYNNENEYIKQGFKNCFAAAKINLIGLSETHIKTQNELLKVENSDFFINKNELTIEGKHNYFNISAAVWAVKCVGLDNVSIKKGLQTFKNEAHRLEFVANINGIDYINDSKATNVDSVWYALDAMKKPIVWIVGGVDKGNDYSVLLDLVKQKVRAIVCLGKDNSKIKAAFLPVQPIIEQTISVAEAIKVASLYAENGDVVLLSPACASFDLFKNYIDRGNQFRNLLLQEQKLLKEGIKIEINIPIQSINGEGISGQ